MWWTIYDKENYCGKKKTSNHLARERVIAQHKALVAKQKPKLELNEEYLKKEVAKIKEALKVSGDKTVEKSETVSESKQKTAEAVKPDAKSDKDAKKLEKEKLKQKIKKKA